MQYNESDFNFICRLMEHEGIFFFFEQTPDGEVMVIADDQGSFIDIPAKRSRTITRGRTPATTIV